MVSAAHGKRPGQVLVPSAVLCAAGLAPRGLRGAVLTASVAPGLDVG